MNPPVVGAEFPIPKFVDPPFSEAKHAGAETKVVEKFTVTIVPVVAPTAATIVKVPRVLLHKYPTAQTTEVIPVPVEKVAVPVGEEIATPFIAVCTKAVLASLVEESPEDCVVAVVPFGRAEAPLNPAAVPEVLAALFGISPLSNVGNCA